MTTKTLKHKEQPKLFHYINPTEVYHFLNMVGGRPLTVIFTKKNIEQRKVTGIVAETTDFNGGYITLHTLYGYKKFHTGRVLWIGEA